MIILDFLMSGTDIRNYLPLEVEVSYNLRTDEVVVTDNFVDNIRPDADNKGARIEKFERWMKAGAEDMFKSGAGLLMFKFGIKHTMDIKYVKEGDFAETRCGVPFRGLTYRIQYDFAFDDNILENLELDKYEELSNEFKK